MTNVAEIILDDREPNNWRILFWDAEGRSHECPCSRFIDMDAADEQLLSELKDMAKWCRFDTISEFSVVR